MTSLQAYFPPGNKDSHLPQGKGERAWPRVVGQVTAGSVLVDQTGVIVPGVVTKDRLMLRDDGIVVVIVTVHKTTGRLLTSPDVISRGFIYLRDNAEAHDGSVLTGRFAI